MPTDIMILSTSHLLTMIGVKLSSCSFTNEEIFAELEIAAVDTRARVFVNEIVLVINHLNTLAPKVKF